MNITEKKGDTIFAISAKSRRASACSALLAECTGSDSLAQPGLQHGHERCPSKTARCAASREDKWIFAITSKRKNELPGMYNRSRLRASEGRLWQIQVEDISFHSCLPALAVHLADLEEFIAPLIKSAEEKHTCASAAAAHGPVY